MKTERTADIFVIDDGAIDNVISKLLINKFDAELSVITLENPKGALDELFYISRNSPSKLPDYIFLDIRMPEMDAWEFLREFERMGIYKLKNIHIIILSSSLDHEDFRKSKLNPLVEDHVIKPLDLQKIRNILGNNRYKIQNYLN
ncbi:MAG: response regulator [Mucilaginibacter sp.]|nr:response regulator [Mucilaginibacter sp.]